MKKILNICVLMFLLVAVTGCNGGGGGSSESNTVYILNPAGSNIPGYKESYSVTGTATNGGKFEGSYNFSVRDTMELEGKIVTPHETLINITNTVTGIFASSIMTTYYDENGNPVLQTDTASNITYTPVSIAEEPDTAEIGDFGYTTTWAGDDGSADSGNWVLKGVEIEVLFL